MANRRLYLTHPETGERVLLGKTLGGGWYTTKGVHQEVLSDFFDRNEDEAALGNSESETQFRLIVED